MTVLVALLPSGAQAAVYDYSVGSTFYTQSTSYYCRPATAELVLSSAGIAAGNIPTQNNLFNTIVANNPGNFTNPPASYSTNVNYYANPTGLRAAIQAADAGHNYVAYNIANVNEANRILAYIDNYKVAAGALVQQGNHWVTVVGDQHQCKTDRGWQFYGQRFLCS